MAADMPFSPWFHITKTSSQRPSYTGMYNSSLSGYDRARSWSEGCVPQEGRTSSSLGHEIKSWGTKKRKGKRKNPLKMIKVSWKETKLGYATFQYSPWKRFVRPKSWNEHFPFPILPGIRWRKRRRVRGCYDGWLIPFYPPPKKLPHLQRRPPILATLASLRKTIQPRYDKE